MSVIDVSGLTFAYEGSPELIFDHVSFQIDTSWKLGFTGRNGRGKTTFLRLLQGKYPYSGTISASVEFEYFPYEVADLSRTGLEAVREIAPEAEDWEIQRELGLLDLAEEALEQPFSSLSNGEQTKVLLAALFLNNGHFLLIDEPTNHLDAKAREIVAEYLKRKKGFILVSHDRSFLDGCVDHILSINRSDIEVQKGNFSSWYAGFLRRQESELARDAKLRKDISSLEKSARRTAAWSEKTEAAKYGNGPVDRGFIGHKSAKMMKRAKSVEARKLKAAEEKSGLLQNLETAEDLKLFPLSYFADTLVSFSDVAPVYNGKEVCRPVSFTVRRGERIALDGGNGSGKSSLLKLLEGEDIDHRGTVAVGSGLVISYVPQDTAGLAGSLSDFAEKKQIEESLFKAVLRKMGFERVHFEKRIEDLSAGQKKKVLIAGSLCQRAHLYVWDEPLNYIDIYSRIQIENLIKKFSPAMIFFFFYAAFRKAAATKKVGIYTLDNR